MQVSRAQTAVSMQTARTDRSREVVRLRADARTSGNLCQYGKRLFNDAVNEAKKKATENDGNVTTSCSSPTSSVSSSKRYHPHNSHKTNLHGNKKEWVMSTGPTQYGSPLYNKRAKLMNSIRITHQPASASEPEEQTSGRRQTLPEIQKTILGSNKNFRVSYVNNNHRDQRNILRDVILIPNSVSPTTNGTLEDDLNAMTAKDSFFLTADVMDNNYDANVPEDLPEKAENDDVTEPLGKVLTDEDITHNAEQLDVPEPEDENTPPQVRPTTPRLVAIPEAPDHQSGDEDDSKPRQESRDIRCWVDSATVSSCSHHSENNATTAAETGGKESAGQTMTEKVTDKVAKLHVGFTNSSKTKPQNPGEPTAANETAVLPDGNAENEQQQQQQQQQQADSTEQVCDSRPVVVSLQQLQQENCSLPSFMFPYSEEQSKEAEIRDWLEKTRFSAARKSLPML